jgi:hypothetical protein
MQRLQETLFLHKSHFNGLRTILSANDDAESNTRFTKEDGAPSKTEGFHLTAGNTRYVSFGPTRQNGNCDGSVGAVASIPNGGTVVIFAARTRELQGC